MNDGDTAVEQLMQVRGRFLAEFASVEQALDLAIYAYFWQEDPFRRRLLRDGLISGLTTEGRISLFAALANTDADDVMRGVVTGLREMVKHRAHVAHSAPNYVDELEAIVSRRLSRRGPVVATEDAADIARWTARLRELRSYIFVGMREASESADRPKYGHDTLNDFWWSWNLHPKPSVGWPDEKWFKAAREFFDL